MSTVVGFICVIAASVWPDTIFEFLLNSSGAIILFVYLLIAISQFVLRRRTPDAQLEIKMWLFPILTLLTIAGIVSVLIGMVVREDTRSQILLSLASFGLVLVVYAVTKRMGGSVDPQEVFAKQSGGSDD